MTLNFEKKSFTEILEYPVPLKMFIYHTEK